MKLSVVIVNYNVKYFLEQCLLSVQKALANVDGEIWVVDNDSVDGSVEMVREKFPNVHCIANTINSGFSVANNQAIKKSNGEYILLLNPDTVVQEDTFRSCIEYLDAHGDVGGLGVKMIDGKGKFLPESKRGLPTPEVALYKMVGLNKLFPHSKRFGKYHLGFIGEDETAEIDVLAGAFMLMRRTVLDKVGLLDETFFMYGEDIDLSYRITQAGYKNIYFPENSIIHYKGESTKRMSVNYVFVFYRAMVIFARKHYKGTSASFFVGLINVSIYVRAFLALVQRVIVKTWLFTLDAILIGSGLVLVKDYWEEHFKYFDGYYAPAYAQTHFPIYTLIWLVMVFWSGGYQKPYSIVKVLRGIIAGTIVISAIYAFLPQEYRYSRAIILAGTASTAFMLLTIRAIAHYKQYRNFKFGQVSNVSSIIVGHKTERHRVLSLIKTSESPNQFIGFVTITEEEGNQILGTLNRLEDLCNLYKVGEVIFCSKDVSSTEIMHWMSKMASTNVSFKIVPDDSGFIIGSNAKDMNGELYTEEIRFALGDKNTIQKKRLIDVVLSVCLLPLGLVIGWFGSGITTYYNRVISTLVGRKTWVSYDSAISTDDLPPLKNGVFPISHESRAIELTDSIRQRLNYFYAKNYHISVDIGIIARNILKP
ncbi:MAG: GT2 family glycosyltransferase [Bacteroidia bacterium]